MQEQLSALRLALRVRCAHSKSFPTILSVPGHHISFVDRLSQYRPCDFTALCAQRLKGLRSFRGPFPFSGNTIYL